MWPKTLYHTRGNVSVRVWSQEQIANIGSGWELREPLPPVAEPEPEVIPEPVPPPVTVKRPRGRPRKG